MGVSPRYIYPSDHAHTHFDRRLADVLGGKGASLAIMDAWLGLPVPPAFIITTEAFRRWRKDASLEFLDSELRDAMSRLEQRAGRTFGASDRPLVLSVRSGAPVSMPGMMDTILDLGLNDATESALAKEIGHEAARDARMRLKAMFEKIIGRAPESDPRAQLQSAIVAVFASWDGARAQTYRNHNGIPDESGTAVVVQSMVFGTAPGISGTGVAFTRNPSTGEPTPVGDWLPNAQGEDVVSGAHATRPLLSMRDDMPTLWNTLTETLDKLELHYQDLCDVEFTIESGRLWLLQARVGKRSARAALRIAVDRAEDPRFRFDRRDAIATIRVEDLKEILESRSMSEPARCLAQGIAASPGIVSGEVCFSADDAVDAASRGERVILVRPETSPADIHGMDAAVGILTATGGLVSHAAIVAREWGKVAVVGARSLEFRGSDVWVGAQRIRQGDVITLDGNSGKIFLGRLDASSGPRPDRAVDTLMGWAEEIAGQRGESMLETLAAARRLVERAALPTEAQH